LLNASVHHQNHLFVAARRLRIVNFPSKRFTPLLRWENDPLEC